MGLRKRLAKINAKRLRRLPNGRFGSKCTDMVLWEPAPPGMPKHPKEVTGLLVIFGITRREIYGQNNRPLKFNNRYFINGKYINFWNRDVDHRALFERARQNFRSLMKQLRPNVESSQEAVDLIAKWTWLKKLFKQHGIS